MGDERGDERPSIVPEGLAIGGRDGVADAAGGGIVGVAAAVGARQSIGRRAEGREPEGRVVAPGLEDPLEGRALEAAMTAGGRERVDPALVGPAAEGVGVDPEQAARRAQGRAGVGRTGTTGDRHGAARLRSRENMGKSGSAGQSGQADYRRRSSERQPRSAAPAVELRRPRRPAPSGGDQLVIVAVQIRRTGPSGRRRRRPTGTGIGRMISRIRPFRQNR